MEQEQRKYNRIIYSSSEDTDQNSDNKNQHNSDPEPRDADPVSVDKNEDAKNDSDQEPIPVPELDPEILTALGEVTEETPKGMNKEAKEKLVKEYPVPENCTLLQAPKLNPEISAAVPEGTRTRDKRVEAVQQQLGQGIAALNKGLELLLDDGKDRLQAIKYLSDSCRLLCDLHFIETEARKKFVTPGLDKSFLNIMQEIERDETLFDQETCSESEATFYIISAVDKSLTSPGKLEGPFSLPVEQGGEGRAKEHCSERGSSSDCKLGSTEGTAAEQAACHNSSTIEPCLMGYRLLPGYLQN
ncbi:hypothetical protein MSG28_009553 [Choristoneura fumiferana]|uniref:Uncharacterized protein n=1 Tax=Choristoneura fumiferana TaxID=7141 RepID=A0ACC0JBM1_CHOFU|nr:hypothetical protein MSG28_009553 [Choristoneura fumiferana]